MIFEFPTKKLPLPPDHLALEHIKRAIDSILMWQRDPYYVPAEGDFARLRSVCAAFGYGSAITSFVQNELEARLNGTSEEFNRFRDRYWEQWFSEKGRASRVTVQAFRHCYRRELPARSYAFLICVTSLPLPMESRAVAKTFQNMGSS